MMAQGPVQLDALLAQAREEAARFFSARNDEDDDDDAADADGASPPPSAVVLFCAPSLGASGLSPCGHQAGGHRHHRGDAAGQAPPLPASLVDPAGGRFCKLLPAAADGRARREARWYARCRRAAEQGAEGPLARLYEDFMPRYHGVARVAGRWLLVLNDVFAPPPPPSTEGEGGARGPQRLAATTTTRRCVMDVKLGRTTSYPWAPPDLAAKCALKDRTTTQAALALRLCGVHCLIILGGGGNEGGGCDSAAAAATSTTTTIWSEDRHWGKALAGAEDVRAALRRFAALGEEENQEEEPRRRRRRRRRQSRRLAELAAEVGRLRACLAVLPHVRLFSSSALLLLEEEEEDDDDDDAEDGEEENGTSADARAGRHPAAPAAAAPTRPDHHRQHRRARVVLVDFAHAFVRSSFEGPDANIIAGLDGLREVLLGAAAASLAGSE